MKHPLRKSFLCLIALLNLLAMMLPAGRLLAYRDLETGEFITRDPAGFVDGPNLYTYVNQNPWTKFDPQGLSASDFIAGMVLGYGETALPWTPSRPAHPNEDYRSGLHTGHVAGAGISISEMVGGSGAAGMGAAGMGAGATVAVAGVATGPGEAVVGPVGGGIALGGMGLVAGGGAAAAHGAWALNNSTKLLAEDMREGAGSSPEPSARRIKENSEAGVKHERATDQQLKEENPSKAVQRERTLRDGDGNKVIDPVTGEGRRVDHAVIDREANMAKTYETTGNNVNKRLQLEKEARIREQGGTYIRDKETRKLVPTEGLSELRRQP